MVSHFVAVTHSRIHITLTALARTDLEFGGFRLCDSGPDSRYCCSTQFGSTGSFRVAVTCRQANWPSVVRPRVLFAFNPSVLIELDVKLVRAVPAVLDSDLSIPLGTLDGRM